MKKIIHICFTSSAFGSFRYAIKNSFLKGEKVIYIDDDLSNGPINCRSTTGTEVMVKFKQVLNS